MHRDFLLLIDLEPDGRAGTGADSWEGARLAFTELTRLRQRLRRVTAAEVRFNWFVRCDPQIASLFGDAACLGAHLPEVVAYLRSEPEFCGIHPHLWRWSGKHGRWYNDFTDPAWTSHCLHTSAAAFEQLFGHRPRASRFGDRFLSNPLAGLLGAAGISYDLTVEPGLPAQPLFDDPLATTWLPDYRRAPRLPYQPSSADFLTPAAKPAADATWMVPVTTTPPRPCTPIRRFPFLAVSSRTLNLVLRPQALWAFLAGELMTETAAPLVAVLRAGDLAEPGYLANFRYLVSRLVEHPGAARLRFSRVDHAIERFAGLA